uniref:Bee-milk protein n=1 Tax=Timema cristinae TaxID=61476 RepID=A0A7R9CYG9_TIMCR|nr:unnamed protein product [Timema cristinae]
MFVSVSLSDKYLSLTQCCLTLHSLRSSQLLHLFWLNLLAVVLVAVYPACQGQLEVINQWSFLPFDLPPDFPTGNYIPENNVFTGLEVGWGRVFLTLPRLRSGVAATLATIPRADLQGQTGNAPTLQAYPNWQWHRAEANCSGLISVYRARADRCDRLWVLDSGIMNSLESYTPVCPPKIVAFDLRTDRLVKSYEFPRASLRLNSLLTNLVIDYQGGQSCDDALIYISDTASPGIVVYDARRDVSWRVTHTSMWPSPDHATYELGIDVYNRLSTRLYNRFGIDLYNRLDTHLYNRLSTRLYNRLGIDVYNRLNTHLYNRLSTRLYNRFGIDLYNRLNTHLYNRLSTRLYNRLGIDLYNRLSTRLYKQA